MRNTILFVITMCLLVEGGADEKGKISVTGNGAIYRKADQLTLVMGVETAAPDAKKAGEANRDKMSQVHAALLQLGLDENEIETKSYTLAPYYVTPPKNPPPDYSPKIAGYKAVNTLQIKTEKIDWAGKIIDIASTDGVNVIQEITFSLKDEQADKEEAIKKAYLQAEAYAKALAEAASVPLGDLLDASISSPYINPVRLSMAKAFVETETPIFPKEVEVTASVSVVYAILPLPEKREK